MFDVVFAKSVIEHLFNPENFMKECYRILKPSGRLIIMTPDWISQMKIFFDDYTHRQPYTLTALKDILDIFLFKDVSSEIFYQIPILWKYPALKAISGIIRLLVPVTAKSNIRFIRWSTELMILGTGVK
jgi:SAM-dependent methyltransferase